MVVFGLFFRFGLLFAFAAFCYLLSFAETSFTFFGLGLHASTTLICIRSSRSLLRQVDPDRRLVDFPSGLMLALFWLFFSSLFFNIVFTSFFFDFGGFWKPKWLPKSIFGEVFGMLFGHPHFGAIF